MNCSTAWQSNDFNVLLVRHYFYIIETSLMFYPIKIITKLLLT